MKTCKECQFEEVNGHAQTCSKRRPMCRSCWNDMSLVKGETHSWQCDTPTCVIHKKKLILSIG